MCRRKGQNPVKIVIAPAKLYPKPEWVEFSEESCRKAIQLTEEYRQIAAIHKAHFKCGGDTGCKVHWLRWNSFHGRRS